MKKVLFIVIDALASRIVDAAVSEGRLPTFARLIRAGVLRSECIAVFPSITPAATCSLATGCYPREHGIAGAHWFDADREEVAYFGADLWAILNRGVDRYLLDFQQGLNEERLRAPTIFEQIERQGTLRDAVINLLWFRGTFEHTVSLPLPFQLAPVDGDMRMRGPKLMFMGDFVNSPLGDGQQIKARGGMLRRYGFHDETTADYLLQLAELEGLPDFTLAYFPNNDFDSHKQGPAEAEPTLEQIDRYLKQLADLHGGLERFLEEYVVVITGDHGQSNLESAGAAAIELDEELADFQLVKAGMPWQEGDELMICPNLRAAQIYIRKGVVSRWREVVERLLECPGIDQVVWCGDANGLSDSPIAEFHVATAERGWLRFHPSGDDVPMGIDDYDAGWIWEGDATALDLGVEGDGRLQWGGYPNAFERIATAFFEKTGSLWVTARVGREFCLPETACNAHGSHGSLQRLDSVSPLIVAGAPAAVAIPEHPRSVDIAPLCLQLLGIEPQRRPGESHV
jgi:hypothetical protein